MSVSNKPINKDLSFVVTLRKLAHAIYREFFQHQNLKISLEKLMLICVLQTLIVGTRLFLTSTHHLWYGTKIRKIGIPL